ncbi:hypothetical protein AAG906_035806 [Vitis piasezkii]
MAKTGGGLSASPSSPTPRPHRATMEAQLHHLFRPRPFPIRGKLLLGRYPTRRPPTDPVPPADQAASSASRPPTKRTKFSGPGEPSHAPRLEPPEDSQFLWIFLPRPLSGVP